MPLIVGLTGFIGVVVFTILTSSAIEQSEWFDDAITLVVTILPADAAARIKVIYTTITATAALLGSIIARGVERYIR